MPRKVQVDELSCEGHGKCAAAAPEVFALDDEDISHVMVDEVPDALLPNVENAIRLCPRQAITWADAPPVEG
ncbi:MAG: ferredoxin [Dehalococcoidia bacterium]